ncbi:MAG: hypothetical protein H5T33_08360 [Candidatus Methanosuratus sp.]|nr:hypothetical protein [Candidatus Methanosuratincola sp.]
MASSTPTMPQRFCLDHRRSELQPEAVVESTLHNQVAYPHPRIFGNYEAGFHTAHHITRTGDNPGYSVYGPPIGRRVRFCNIANGFDEVADAKATVARFVAYLPHRQILR